jgi:macrolide transport system ATP-binding/permease protein
MLLMLENISKSYGDNLVLERVSFTLDTGQKLGLVGANGVGKSTLLKIVTSEVEPDGGAARRAPSYRLGYLPQVLAASAGQSIDELIAATLGDLTTMEAQLRELEAAMAAPRSAEGDLNGLLAEYGRLSEAFERRGGYDLEYRLAAILTGLQVAHLGRSRPIDTLSGGEKSRIGLAALLLAEPDLLLLDEPTNHLDFAALAWLEEFLTSFRGGLLVVSHDRHFLNRTVHAIVEISEHDRTAHHYAGDYDFYAAAKRQERAKWEADYWAQQEEIWELRKAVKTSARQVAHNRPPRDGDKYLAYFKEQRIAGLISRNVRSAEERLRRIEEDPIPRPPRQMEINPEFDPAALVSHTPLWATDLHKRYGSQTVLDGIDVSIAPTSRVVIVGPNGAGKSTLLRILAGVETPDQGSVSVAASVVRGYLDQEQQTLDENAMLFDAYRGGRPGEYEEFKAELLSYGLFVYPDLEKPVRTLSVGQKRKLQLACLLAQRANLLLLDEPTNHISLDVLEEFERALGEFRGPIVAVSHDRRFIERFAQEIWEMRGGRLRRYLGGWEEFAAANAMTAAL